jgi:hypothetical protein
MRMRGGGGGAALPRAFVCALHLACAGTELHKSILGTYTVR